MAAKEASRVIVAGAGMSGLTAAAYLARAGCKVMVIEKNKDCGGLVSSFQRAGFHFDAGAKSILNAGILRPMLKQLGIDLDLSPARVSIGIENKVIDFDSKERLGDYQRLLEHFYPESAEDIKQIITCIERVWKDMAVMYGIDNPFFVDVIKNPRYLFKKMLPWLGKFLQTISRIGKLQEPVEEYLHRFSSNQPLIDIIAQHFFKNTPMFFALGYFYVYLDYMYPKGGTGNISKYLKQKIIEWGGEIKTGLTVTRIRPSTSEIIDSIGNSHAFSHLIWCADLKTFYAALDELACPEKIRREIQETRAKLATKRGGDSIFALYCGIDEPSGTFKAISRGHFFYTPSRKGLGEIHRSTLRSLVDHFEDTPKELVLHWLDEYCKYTTYEISIPSLRDPSLAPEGKTGINFSMLFEYDLIKKVQEASWYGEFKKEVESRVLNVVSSTIYPCIKEKLLFCFSSTPLDVERFAGTSEGAITGWSYESPVPAVNDLRKIARAVKTPIPNIWQAGQWTFSPAGMPTSILTGWFAARQVMKKVARAHP
ncbi:MAG: NAD(P)/FAD-dependent oxidoreductase [Candidatus Lokiarchaeota archaeon]|nr:NAD(P)/FAD-dependent oxidoreductase [Candidatus Lokiarchaeota archaeon]